MLTVGRAFDFADRRARGAEHALVLEGAEDVRVAAVPVFARRAGVVQVEARRQDDGADLDFGLTVALVVQQGARAAGAHALHALGADRAVEAAPGLGDRLFL